MKRALPVATGLVIDRLAGDPDTDLHPVAAFGKLMDEIEDRIWADTRERGALHAGIGIAFGLATGLVVHSTAAVTSLALSGNKLRSTAQDVSDLLDAGDLDQARVELKSLVGRDTADLDESEIAAAAIESLAENMVDAVFAPVCWGLVAGAPGVAAYRAVNTMDAMVGNFSERHAAYGWASARLDDLANWVPARIFAVAVVLSRPSRRGAIRRAVTRDARWHPSPNSGIAEAAVAAAMGLQLGGALSYDGQVEVRPLLGDGRRPQQVDIEATIRLMNRIEWGLTGTLLAVGVTPILLGRLKRRWWS
jgi:adenosylcobinamide-phosphate synthase